jgi:hypothetical protein
MIQVRVGDRFLPFFLLEAHLLPLIGSPRLYAPPTGKRQGSVLALRQGAFSHWSFSHPSCSVSSRKQNKSNVKHVVAIMIPGILSTDLGIAQPSLSTNLPFALAPTSEGLSSKLPVFQSLFSHACPTKAPGEKNKMHSCYQSFTTTPLTGAEKERRERARKERMSYLVLHSISLDLTELLLACRRSNSTHLRPLSLPPLPRPNARTSLPSPLSPSLPSPDRLQPRIQL